MALDGRGLELTTESEAAAVAFETTVQRSLEYRADTADHIQQVLEVDPGFAMGHCLKGLLLTGFQSTRMRGAIGECVAAAEAASGHTTWREKANIAALKAMSEGRRRKACDIWEEILVKYPTDLLVLRHLTHALFWGGRSIELRDSVARVVRDWDDALPGYGFMLGMYSFGLEETGEYCRAEELGKRAVELNRNDLWAVHSVAHVLEMMGRLQDGIDWLTESGPDWADRNPFKSHLWWHLALYHVERGEFARVLKLYDFAIRTEGSDFYIEIQNASSLLWRLDFLGVDVEDRWQKLADTCETRIGDMGLGFTTTHDMMALAMAGRDQAAQNLLAALREHVASNDDYTAEHLDCVTIPVCEAIVAYACKNYGVARQILSDSRDEFIRDGASHAQRDVYVQAMIESALRGGEMELARALLGARLETKPHGFGSWQKYAEALEAMGDRKAASAARAKAAKYSVH